MRRDHWLREIEKLDPETGHQRIYRISGEPEFPWDLSRATRTASTSSGSARSALRP